MLAGFAGLLALGVVAVTTSPGAENSAAAAVLPSLVVAVPAALFIGWRVEPVWLLSAAIVLSPVAGYWPELGIPGAIAPDRLLLIAGVGSVLARSPAARDRAPLRIAPVHLLMLLAVVYVGLSSWISGTLTEISWFAKLFDAFGVMPFLVFLVAPFVFRERWQRDILLGTLVILGAYLGFTAIVERMGLDALVFPKYILNADVGIHLDRSRGPFLEAVTNGFALYVCLVACAIAFKQWRGQTRGRLAGWVALLCIAGIVLCLERSVWLAATAATLVTILTLGSERRTALKAIAAIAVVVGFALVAIPGLSNDVSERFNDQATINDRQNLARAAGNMIEARPLTGFGWGEFVPNSYDYFEQAEDYPLGRVAGIEIHSTALIYLVELGLIGTALWLAAVVMGVAGGVSRRGPPDLDDWRIGFLAIAIAYAIVTNFVPPQVFPNLIFWLWAGVAWVGYQDRSKPPRKIARRVTVNRTFPSPPRWES